MLAERVAQEFGDRVAFVAQNFADSELARRFGVRRYPAFFVGDELVATPKDFGFFGQGEGAEVARYAPFASAEGHRRFCSDLQRAIERRLAGDAAQRTAAAAVPAADALPIATLPELALTDLDGKPLRNADLTGEAVLVDFWACWCPPCRGTLPWLAELQRRFGDRLAVVALAVDSAESEVRACAARHGSGLRWAMATPAIGRGFGDVSSLPTLFVFDATGAAKAVFYGAPPTLHDDVERALEPLLR